MEVEEEPLQCTPDAEEEALDGSDDEVDFNLLNRLTSFTNFELQQPQVVMENEEELGSDDETEVTEETEEAVEIEIAEVPDKVKYCVNNLNLRVTLYSNKLEFIKIVNFL